MVALGLQLSDTLFKYHLEGYSYHTEYGRIDARCVWGNTGPTQPK